MLTTSYLLINPYRGIELIIFSNTNQVIILYLIYTYVDVIIVQLDIIINQLHETSFIDARRSW